VTGVYSGMVINYSFVIITDSCKEFSLIWFRSVNLPCHFCWLA
jgi:hypothetical protein